MVCDASCSFSTSMSIITTFEQALNKASYLACEDLGISLSEIKKFNTRMKFKSCLKGVVIIIKLNSIVEKFKKNL